MAWKSADGKAEASHLVSQLETLINGMLNKATLLDLVRHFIVFEKSKKEDAQTGVISISTVKKLAAYHQYYAVNAAVASTLRAVGTNDYLPQAINEPEASYGLPGVTQQPKGDRKAGVVWHTQGSGKSLSMVFYTGKIVLVLDNPRYWSLPTITTWTTSCSIPLPPHPSYYGKNPNKPTIANN
jgi:type I restriction enzyme R subunit